MNKLEQLRRAVIEAIYNEPYEIAEEMNTKIITEGCCSECMGANCVGNERIFYKPITIGRVMQSIEKLSLPSHVLLLPSGNIYMFVSGTLGTPFCNWQLSKGNGEECTLEDQSEKTIEALLKLFNNKS
jgi:hypothetical protein